MAAVVSPSAASSATRRSVAVSDSGPRPWLRRGLAPSALSSWRALCRTGSAPQVSAISRADKRCSRASARLLERLKAEPSSSRALACSRRRGVGARSASAWASSVKRPSPAHKRACSRRASPTSLGTPKPSAMRSSSSSSSVASRVKPQAARQRALRDRHPIAGRGTPRRATSSSNSWRSRAASS